MAIRVMIPTALRRFADGTDTIELEPGTVQQVIGSLTDRFPQLKPHLLSDEGELRNFVNVYVNHDNIRDKENEQTSVREGDELSIVPAVAGGGSSS